MSEKWTMGQAMAHNAKIAGVGAAPTAPSRNAQKEEKLHAEIEAECARRGWYIVHSRMDRPTTTKIGVCDFVIAADGGRTFWIEAKGAKTKVSREQAGAIVWLQKLGHKAAIVRSIEEFMEVIK